MNLPTKIIALAVALLFATSAFAVDVQETIIMMQHMTLQMNGKPMQADLVKMHGHMYVMMLVDDLPDPLHQQVFRYIK